MEGNALALEDVDRLSGCGVVLHHGKAVDGKVLAAKLLHDLHLDLLAHIAVERERELVPCGTGICVVLCPCKGIKHLLAGTRLGVDDVHLP